MYPTGVHLVVLLLLGRSKIRIPATRPISTHLPVPVKNMIPGTGTGCKAKKPTS
jgi:hypothetical protein